MKSYDFIIVGGGPAGLSAGIYASRARIATLLIERSVLGGQIANTDRVENYPAFPQGVSGFELSQAMHQQATRFGMETAFATVEDIRPERRRFQIATSEGDYQAKAVLIASGADHSKLQVPGEEEFLGKGVSYCAVCDGAFFRDQTVAVIGGGDSAIDEALFLTRFVSRVIVIHRRDQLRAQKILQEMALANPKMEFIWNTVVTEIQGDEEVRSLRLKNVATGEFRDLEVSGVFVYVGQTPNTEFARKLLPLSPGGFVVVNDLMATAVPGLFAAGDVRVNSARQAVTAAGDGVTATLAAEKYIRE